MKKIKIISMTLAAIFAVESAFALPSVFNGKLTASERASIEKGNEIVRNLKSVKDFCITSTDPKILEAQNTVKALKPAYLAEVVKVMPYKGNENLAEKISKLIMDVPSYAGIPYWSERNQKWYELYSSATIKSTSTSGSSQILKADLFMEPFGLINTTITSQKSGNTFYYLSTNDNTLKYNGVTCVKSGNMKSIICVVKEDDSWILYGIGAVNAPDVFFLRDRIETSFMNRIKTFCSYFFKKL